MKTCALFFDATQMVMTITFGKKNQTREFAKNKCFNEEQRSKVEEEVDRERQREKL